MAQTMASTANKPAWVDLSSADAGASREFYAKLFGWKVEVNPDPQYGGYALARIGGQDAAGIGPKMDPNGPTAWSLYIGTDDIDALAKQGDERRRHRRRWRRSTSVTRAGWPCSRTRPAPSSRPGRAPAWAASRPNAPNSFGWAELNARGVDKALPFYTKVFGWTVKTSPMGDGQPDYNEFQIDGKSVAGAWEMNAMVPAEVPSYWLVYFDVDDVDAAHRKALELGAKELNAPMDFPGGKFSIVSDPQGASFGLIKMAPR